MMKDTAGYGYFPPHSRVSRSQDEEDAPAACGSQALTEAVSLWRLQTARQDQGILAALTAAEVKIIDLS